MAAPSPNSPLGDLVAAAEGGDPSVALAAAKRGYAAFLRGEMSLDDPAVDPNVEWIPPKHAPTAGAYQGAAEAEEEVLAWREPFDDFRWEPKEMLLGEGCFVVVGKMGVGVGPAASRWRRRSPTCGRCGTVASCACRCSLTTVRLSPPPDSLQTAETRPRRRLTAVV